MSELTNRASASRTKEHFIVYAATRWLVLALPFYALV